MPHTWVKTGDFGLENPEAVEEIRRPYELKRVTIFRMALSINSAQIGTIVVNLNCCLGSKNLVKRNEEER